MGIKKWKSTLIAVLLLQLFTVESHSAPGDYTGLRDPFQIPERNIGELNGAEKHQHPGTPNNEAGDNPKTSNPTQAPLPENSALSKYVTFTFGVFSFANQAWRPSIVFVADQIKGEAVERVVHAFSDIATAYLYGPGWGRYVTSFTSKYVLGKLFLAYQFLEPSDLDPSSELDFNSDLGKDADKLRDYLKRLHEQRVKEPESEKLKNERIPGVLLLSPDFGDFFNTSTEEQRRASIFNDQNISKAGARLAIAKAAGLIYGKAIGTFTDDWLWLYDSSRISDEGISQAAINIFNEGSELIKTISSNRKNKRRPNLCLIQPPQWIGNPRKWACSLGYYDNPTRYCYCPSFVNYQPIPGTPLISKRGYICKVSDTVTCPMKHGGPVGAMCGCSGYVGIPGRVDLGKDVLPQE